MKLKGKVALVTGGSGGIGSVVCKTLARQGASVAVFSKDGKIVQKVVRDITQSGGRAVALVGDVARPQDITRAVAAALRIFKRIDVLVNCAGIQEPIGLFAETDAAKWKKNIEVNLLGTVLFAHAVLPGMLKRKSGSIVNFSGGGASGPRPHFSAYAVAKTGVVKFTEILAHETFGKGVRVNAVAPGSINTGMLEEVLRAGPRAGKEFEEAKVRKVKGGASAENAAALVLFLASEDSAPLSGKLIAAIWDGWKTWNKAARKKIQESDTYTLRRVT